MAADATVQRTTRYQTDDQGGVSIAPGDIRPVPDPTALTTQAVDRATAFIREIYDAKIDAFSKDTDSLGRAIEIIREELSKRPQEIEAAIKNVRDLIETRLSGMDKALELLPAQIASSIDRLQELHEEKFKSISIQFAERDTRTEQTSKDSKVAVDAALQAAKEAVGEQNKSSALAISKSEAATTKQIDAIGLLIQSNTKNIDDKIDDLKGRLTAVEAHKQGSVEQKTSSNSSINDHDFSRCYDPIGCSSHSPFHKMNWESATYWFTAERYEMRIIRPDLWVMFGPDGWVDMANSMSEVKDLAEQHLKEHPIAN